MGDGVSRAIEIQQLCIDRYIELVEQVKSGEIEAKVRLPLSDNGLRTIMRMAIEEVKGHHPGDSFFPYTREVLGIWIDRARTERARKLYPM